MAGVRIMAECRCIADEEESAGNGFTMRSFSVGVLRDTL